MSLIPKMKVVVSVGEGETDEVDLQEFLPYELTQALQAQRDAGAEEERERIEAMIEEANYARKVGEKTGDPIAVWEVQDVIRQILALTPLPDKE